MKNTTNKTLARIVGATAIMLLAGTVQAHPGHIGDHDSFNMFAHGFAHPLTGVDHLLVMLAVGIWSALTHVTLREAIALPFVFAVFLFAGAVMGIAGISLPAIEPMIMGSLLVLGLLVASRFTMKNSYSFALVGIFAMFHGLAHGMELPQSSGGMAFVLGFMATTLALHLAGLYAGFKIKNQGKWMSRVLGAGIAGYGAFLFVGL